MNGYLSPTAFWLLMSASCIGWLYLALSDLPIWWPTIMGIIILASLLEWAAEQHWWERVQLVGLGVQLTQVANDTAHTYDDIRNAQFEGDHDAVVELQQYLVDLTKARQRIREKIAAIRYDIDGEIEGVDYTLDGKPIRRY